MAGFRFEEGGVVRAVLDMCGALAARGHDVTLMTFDRRDVPDDWLGRDGRPAVVTLPPKAAADTAEHVFADADVVHLHVPWDAVCLQLGRLARARGVPYVISLHGMLDDWCMKRSRLKKRAYLAFGGRRLLEQAGAVHCTAEAEASQSSRWYPRGRPAVLPLIFDVQQFEQLPGPKLARDKFMLDDRPVVLFLSRLDPKKRIEMLIESAAKLRDDGVRCRFIVAGTGEPDYEQALRRLVADRDLAGHIEFIGFVSGPEKLSLYEASDLFVLPTHQENWGFVLIESLACGVPVITTRGVDIWSDLESSGGAAIVDAQPAPLAATIRDLLEDQDRRREMGRRGRSWVLESLHPDRVVSSYVDLYRSIADGHR